MESEPTPRKVQCLYPKPANLQVSECVRQFKLPQQFPSTLVGHTPVAMEHVLNDSNSFETRQPRIKTLPNLLLSNAKKITPTQENRVKQIKTLKTISPVSTSLGTNTNSPTKLKTLKLKGPDGKDLGEFQVEVVSEQTNSLKRKLVPVRKDESQENEEVSSTQSEPVVSYSVKDLQYPGAIYQEPRIKPVEKDMSSKIKIISNVSLNRGSNGPNSPNQPAIKKLFSTSLGSLNTKKINHPFFKLESNRVIFQNKNSASIVNDSQPNEKKVLYFKTNDHTYLKNISNSEKPLSLKPVKLKSLNLRISGKDSSESNFIGLGGLLGLKNGDLDEDDNEVISLDSKSAHGSNASVFKKDVILQLPKSSMKKLTKKLSSESSSDFGSFENTDEEDEDDFENTDESSTDSLHLRTESKSTSPTPNTSAKQKTFEIRKNPAQNTENDTVKKNAENEPGKINTEKETGKRNTEKGTGKRNTEKEILKNNISLDISIVERALASVRDKFLREEALKVLQTCRLGVDRLIPIKIPSDKALVRDTSSQTNVFGNLDPECEEFVEVKEDEKGVKRINKKMRDHSMAYNSLNSAIVPVEQNQTSNFALELDKIINNLDLNSEDKEEVENIKSVLEKPIQCNERIYQIKNQVAKDCKMLTTYDENGYTGLHRAVLDNDVKSVKRLLMILGITKSDVDFRSQNGKTSLELAIRAEADKEIVEALLEIGAKPTSDEVGYDSALMIASKNSSSHLPLIAEYARNKHLDCIDEEGFAAIHHCASRGNVTGIKALLLAGTDINQQDCRSGRTALFHAIENQHIETARQLLLLGAKPGIRNTDGHTIIPLVDDPRYQTLKNAVQKAMK